MPLVPTPYDRGFADGVSGATYCVPREYTVWEAKQYEKGYGQGYDQRRKEIDAVKQRSTGSSPVPYIDDTWIPRSSPVPYIDDTWIPK